MAREINDSDNFREMILKKIPSETVLGIIAANGAILAMDEGTAQTVFLWVAFAIFLIATPFWLYFGMNVKKPLQIISSSVAFVIWAMTMEGAFTTITGYELYYGTIILTLYTLGVSPVIGMIIKKT